MIERIEAAQVGNAERSQRCQAQAHAVFHDVVNVLYRGGTGIDDVHGFPQDGKLQTVDDKAVDVLDADRILS